MVTRRAFATLFDECFDDPRHRHEDTKVDARLWFLDTVNALDATVNHGKVLSVLLVARRRQVAARAEPRRAAVRRARRRLDALSRRLRRDIGQLVRWHAVLNPKRFLGHPKFADAAFWEQALLKLDHDRVFQEAELPRRRGAHRPTRPWYDEALSALCRCKGITEDNAKDLLRQLGMLVTPKVRK